MKYNINSIVGYLFIALTFTSVYEVSRIPIGNTLLYYIVSFSFILLSLYFCIKQKLYSYVTYLSVTAYLIWAFLSIIRGALVIDSYWVLNQLIRGTISVLVPIVVFLYHSPDIFSSSLRWWNNYIVLIFITIFSWAINHNFYLFILYPFYCFYGFFIHKMNKKWRIITLLFLIIVGTSFDNRTAVLKVLFCIAIFIANYYKRFFPIILIHIGHWLFYIAPCLLLYLGINGYYNVFSGKSIFDSPIDNTIIFSENQYLHKTPRSTNVDTRTFIYEEAIASAFLHNYVWTGRTPARGYDSDWFGAEIATVSGLDRQERFASELCHVNTFTWLGIIGVLLITIIHLQASILALYFSRNHYIKYIALSISFNWAYGWVENVYQFHQGDVLFWMLAAICLSPKFRAMSDVEFSLWFKSLFIKPSLTTYSQKYSLLKYFFIRKIINNNEGNPRTICNAPSR